MLIPGRFEGNCKPLMKSDKGMDGWEGGGGWRFIVNREDR